MSLTIDAHHLIQAGGHDTDELQALLCLPDVYRYLADGAPPPRDTAQRWIAASERDFAARGFGVWLLRTADGKLIGCVRMSAPDASDLDDGATAELLDAVHPDHWGAGFATRMSRAAIAHVFASAAIARIVAGADSPNAASIAVMRRLGMIFLRNVTYPLGPGVEYSIRVGAGLPANSS